MVLETKGGVLMDTNFSACLATVLEREGGFADLDGDPGGATNLGVTIGTLSGWLGRQATVDDVKALTPATVSPIYKALFWDKSHCGELPNGVDLMVFDTAVNAGVGRGVRQMQQALGVTADGVYGPQTAAAVAAIAPAELVQKDSDVRRAYYESLSNFPRFGRGWLNRLAAVTTAALQMAGGTNA